MSRAFPGSGLCLERRGGELWESAGLEERGDPPPEAGQYGVWGSGTLGNQRTV